MKKTLAVLNVLLIASVLAFADLHPTPPPHPDAVPDPSSPLPTEVHPDFGNYTPASGGTTSVYDDAIAVWTFNDPTDLGADNGDGTYDLTLVNTPTATGGALGYAAAFSSTGPEYAVGSSDIIGSGNRTVIVAASSGANNCSVWAYGDSVADGSPQILFQLESVLR